LHVCEIWGSPDSEYLRLCSYVVRKKHLTGTCCLFSQVHWAPK
jgi:hypothetical protein